MMNGSSLGSVGRAISTNTSKKLSGDGLKMFLQNVIFIRSSIFLII